LPSYLRDLFSLSLLGIPSIGSLDYIGKFLETIKKEGMEPEKIEIKVPVRVLNRRMSTF
jgi:hypothetical protein